MYLSTRFDGASATMYGIFSVGQRLLGSRETMDTHVVRDRNQIELIGGHTKFYHDIVLCAFVHCARIGNLGNAK